VTIPKTPPALSEAVIRLILKHGHQTSVHLLPAIFVSSPTLLEGYSHFSLGLTLSSHRESPLLQLNAQPLLLLPLKPISTLKSVAISMMIKVKKLPLLRTRKSRRMVMVSPQTVPAVTLRQRQWKTPFETRGNRLIAFPVALIALVFASIMRNLHPSRLILMRRIRSTIYAQTASYRVGCRPATAPQIS
jgi:hypothetical protein